jgi:AcrR family transcriptional regulator
LAGFSLRDVAKTIGLRPPSLYWYFESKQAIYDAMFAEANSQLLACLHEQEWPRGPRAILRLTAHVFVSFSAADTERYQLLFQRTIPDFEPSPESYALALQVFEEMRARYSAAGLSDPTHFDIWTALVAGLAAQQISNDPGGDRWVRLIDEVVDMYADRVLGKGERRRTS